MSNQEHTNTSSRVLIISPQGIGDVLMAIPMIEFLRNHMREAVVGVLVRDYDISEMMERAKIADRAYVIENYSLRNYLTSVRQIIKDKYDTSITTSNIDQFKGSFLPFICGVRQRIGEIKNRRLHFYTKKLKYNGKIHKIEQNLKLLSLINIKVDRFNLPKFVVKDKEEKEIDDFLDVQGLNNSFLIGIVSSSNPRGAGRNRRWAPEKFAELCDIFAEEQKVPVFLGNKSDKEEVIPNILSLMKHTNCILDASGIFTLFQTAALIKRCKVVIGNDSGLMHIAAALGVPTIAIFGHTNRYAHRPYHKKSYIVFNKNLKCSPCVDVNPYGACKDRKCLQDIYVKDVLTKFRDKIDGQS